MDDDCLSIMNFISVSSLACYNHHLLFQLEDAHTGKADLQGGWRYIFKVSRSGSSQSIWMRVQVRRWMRIRMMISFQSEKMTIWGRISFQIERVRIWGYLFKVRIWGRISFQSMWTQIAHICILGGWQRYIFNVSECTCLWGHLFIVIGWWYG